MELYARVRRAVQVEGKSERQVAREYGLARETVRKMLRYSIPPGYRRQQPAKRPKLDPWVGVIDAILERGSREAPETAPHGQENLPTIARGARIQRWIHHREGLRASAEAEAAGDVRAAGASGRRRPGGLRGSAGGDRRRGAQGALSGDGSAAVGRLLRDGLPGRDDGGISGRAQPGVCLLWGSAAEHSVRQHEAGGRRRSWETGRGRRRRHFRSCRVTTCSRSGSGGPARETTKEKWRGWSAMRGGTSWFRCRGARVGKS